MAKAKGIVKQKNRSAAVLGEDEKRSQMIGFRALNCLNTLESPKPNRKTHHQKEQSPEFRWPLASKRAMFGFTLSYL